MKERGSVAELFEGTPYGPDRPVTGLMDLIGTGHLTAYYHPWNSAYAAAYGKTVKGCAKCGNIFCPGAPLLKGLCTTKGNVMPKP